jgi:DNA-binding winged helix-turn-helix (wHTH) protein
MRVTFGGVVLDSDARQVRRGTEAVPLSPKAFDLLTYLVDHRPNALSKDVLHERLWPGVFVSDTNLAGLVAEIRRALGDDARTPRFVRTVQRFGYAFAGKVDSVADGAAPSKGSPSSLMPGPCWLVRGSRRIPLADGENILGRDENGGPLASNSISRRHARITVAGGDAYIEDLGSKNGTQLRGRSITRRERLADGDAISLGGVVLHFGARPGIARPARGRNQRGYDAGPWRIPIDVPCLGDFGSFLERICRPDFGPARAR